MVRASGPLDFLHLVAAGRSLLGSGLDLLQAVVAVNLCDPWTRQPHSWGGNGADLELLCI